MKDLVPDVEVWGHHDSIHKSLLGRFVFGNVSLTNEWNHHPNSSVEWSAGGITLSVTHSPGHAPGHCTFHGHGVYHAETCFSQPHRVELTYRAQTQLHSGGLFYSPEVFFGTYRKIGD